MVSSPMEISRTRVRVAETPHKRNPQNSRSDDSRLKRREWGIGCLPLMVRISIGLARVDRRAQITLRMLEHEKAPPGKRTRQGKARRECRKRSLFGSEVYSVANSEEASECAFVSTSSLALRSAICAPSGWNAGGILVV